MLDFELGRLYGVTTGNLNKAVKRNRNRFPPDFMFQLTAEEAKRLIFQFGTSKGRGGRRHLPHAPLPLFSFVTLLTLFNSLLFRDAMNRHD